MSQDTENEQMEAYTEAATSGLYAKQSGLVGKYDNVRRLWEDEITRLFLHPHLERLMERMRLVVEGVGWLGLGLPRENIIEPQLGYALRYLEMKLQQGQGCAHGLLGIFEVDKA